MVIKKTIFRSLLVYIAIGLILLWTLGPFYWMIVTSIGGQRDLMAFPPDVFPETFTLDRYRQLLGLADPSLLDADIAVAARLFRRALALDGSSRQTAHEMALEYEGNEDRRERNQNATSHNHSVIYTLLGAEFRDHDGNSLACWIIYKN